MKKYWNSFKYAIGLIAKNWKTWILFIVFYNVVCSLLYGIAVYGMYAASLKVAGISYIAPNTLGSYLLCPFTWLVIIVSLALCVFLIMFEVSSFYKMYEASRLGLKVTLSCVLLSGIKTAARCIRFKNWKLFLYLILMLPILGISTFSSAGYSITIPGFIMNSIYEMKVVYIILCALFVLLLIYACRLQYSVPALVYDGGAYNDAIKKSKRMIKGKFFYSILSVIATYLIVCVAFSAVGALGGLIVAAFKCSEIGYAIYVGILISFVCAAILIPSVIIAQTSSLYYEIAEEKGETLPAKYEGIDNDNNKDSNKNSNKNKSSITAKIVIAIIFLGCLALTIAINLQDTSITTAKLNVPEIAAHRGDSGNAPENTMPAFEQAVADGCCDWIELDVHQTKDGVIVVCHDDSLSRIDGSDRCVHEMTYDELLQVDFGARFSEEYVGTKIATLDEVLDYCDGKIKVQIEIKPTEYDNQIEEAVVEIIKNHDMVDDCVVLSLDDAPLRKIKEIAPEITTMYCMALTSGEVTDIDFAEYISIEEQNVTPEIVSSMHAQNRKVFAWTINDTDFVQYLVDCGVDVILTDYPTDIDAALKDADYLGGLVRISRMMIQWRY